MKRKPTVSVCVVTYNSNEDIIKCLSSLFKHCKEASYNLQVYISDNKSTDSTVQSVKKTFPRVTIIQNYSNKGFGHGHNTVINKLKSDYHIILNPDIIFAEDSISILVDYMENNPGVIISTPEIKNLDNSIQHLPKMFPKIKYVLSSTVPAFSRYRIPYTKSDEYIETPTPIKVCTGCFMLTRTEQLIQVAGFDDRFFMYFEDFDLSISLSRFGEIIYNPATYVYHKWNRESKKSKKMFVIQIKSMVKFYLKHPRSIFKNEK